MLLIMSISIRYEPVIPTKNIKKVMGGFTNPKRLPNGVKGSDSAIATMLKLLKSNATLGLLL